MPFLENIYPNLLFNMLILSMLKIKIKKFIKMHFV